MSHSSSSVFGQYAALFKIEGVTSLVVAMVIARIPTGCISLLLVLFVSEQFNAAIAGMAVAAWTIGTALLAPYFGRLVDKGNGPVALRACSFGQAISVTAFIVFVVYGGAVAGVIACSFVCGALTPPVAGTTRSLWKILVPEELLACAYSFEILLIDILFVSGPLVASVFIAFGISVWGIGLTTACLIGGSIALSVSDPVKKYAEFGKRMYEDPERDSHSLFKKPTTWLLMLTCMGTMAFSGWLETLLPLFYSDQGQSYQGGVAISIWSIGSILGVLFFVRLQPSNAKVGLTWQLVACSAAYLVVCSFLPLGESFLVVCGIMFCVGLFVSSCTNLHYQLGGELAPAANHAEMFSWLNTATSAGISIGALLAGNAVEYLGYGVSFQLPVLFVVAALAFAVLLAVVVRKAAAVKSTR